MEINLDLNKKLYCYPFIEQYRNLIHTVKHAVQFIGVDENGDAIYNSDSLPTLNFIGTVKKHGTNAAIVISEGEIYFQSHHNIITPIKDNAGFALAMSKKQKEIYNWFTNSYLYSKDNTYIIYGEWCGGNIQAGVGLSQCEKMFVIFDILIIYKSGVKVWSNPFTVRDFVNIPLKMYNSYQFPTYRITIDFNHPELSQNKLIELTTEVEARCPVAAAFGKNGIGEGVVWVCVNLGYDDPKFRMKVKGEKHSSSKVKTLAEVDIEAVNSINDFAEKTVTESRLWQGIEQLKQDQKPLTKASLGDFIRWIYNDIMKEEMDTILANNLDPQKLGKPLGDKCRKWFFENEINFDKK